MESWVRQFGADTRGIITQPKTFFDAALSPEGLSRGLAGIVFYGLICHWIGATFSFYFGTVANEILMDAMSRFIPDFRSQRDLVFNLLFGGVFVALDPLFHFFRLIFGTLFLQFSGTLFLPRVLPNGAEAGTVDFEKLFRISCLSEATSLFRLVPLAGNMIALIYRFYVLAVGIHRATGHSLGRALWVVVFPYVLLFFLAVSFIVLLVAFAVGVAVQ